MNLALGLRQQGLQTANSVSMPAGHGHAVPDARRAPARRQGDAQMAAPGTVQGRPRTNGDHRGVGAPGPTILLRLCASAPLRPAGQQDEHQSGTPVEQQDLQVPMSARRAPSRRSPPALPVNGKLSALPARA